MTSEGTVVREGYEAFNARDIERAIRLMRPDVVWPDAVNGGFVHGHEGVRRHWEDVFDRFDPQIDLEDLGTGPAGTWVAQVRQTTRSDQGTQEDLLTHVFQFENGRIRRLDVVPRQADDP
jgi:ketosteroid isomerase-like protein